MVAYIPYHRKDRQTLQAVVRGVRDFGGTDDVVVVTASENRRDLYRAGARFLDEDKVIEGVDSGTLCHPRWGWYFQQLLKLGIAFRDAPEHYLVVDADTVFLNPVPFMTSEGRPYYTRASEFHPPYFWAFERLLGFSASREYSFVAHHMVFRSQYVREMCERFRPETPWWRNVVSLVQPQPPWNSLSQFSEYETYGYYLKACHPDELTLRDLRWRNSDRLPTGRLLTRLRRDLDYCSFQAYLREERRLSRPWRVWLSRLRRRLTGTPH